ncbi:hypothetical protein K2X05_05610 [bacterium]|nr:hypothetical protein [bacterium]
MKNTTKKSLSALLLFFFFTMAFTGCDSISQLFSSKPEKKEYEVFLEKMYIAYNKKNLDEYCSFFDQEINVTKEQGLGNTRIITGQKEFHDFYANIFRSKRDLKLTLLEYFSVPPWILVKELIEHEDKVYEAAVGYRMQNDRIIHKMILSDRFVYNKKTLFDKK